MYIHFGILSSFFFIEDDVHPLWNFIVFLFAEDDVHPLWNLIVFLFAEDDVHPFNTSEMLDNTFEMPNDQLRKFWIIIYF